MKANECCHRQGVVQGGFICASASICGRRSEQQDRVLIHFSEPPSVTFTKNVATSENKKPEGIAKRRLFGDHDEKNSGAATPLVGVFDGHLGANVSEYLAHHLPKYLLSYCSDTDGLRDSIVRMCLAMDHELLYGKDMHRTANCGSTASFSFVIGNKLVLVNVGDSRSIQLSFLAANKKFVAKQWLSDHVPSIENEKRRILEAHMTVDEYGIDGVLSVSRAFGDKRFKRQNILKKTQGSDKTRWDDDPERFLLLDALHQPVIAYPDIHIIDNPNKITDNNTCNIILHCTDGVTSRLNNTQILEHLEPFLNEYIQHPSSKILADAAQSLCLHAIHCGSTDNCTALLFDPSKTFVQIPPLSLACSEYTVGPYYPLDISFHHSFMATAQLAGCTAEQIQQLIHQGSHQKSIETTM
jgi:serine/threonine protein phosphatase PrpC